MHFDPELFNREARIRIHELRQEALAHRLEIPFRSRLARQLQALAIRLDPNLQRPNTHRRAARNESLSL